MTDDRAPALYLIGAPSIDVDATNHDVTLTWYAHQLADGGEFTSRAVVKVRVDAMAALDLARQAVNAATRTAADSLSSLAHGPCGTCGNTRMVNVSSSAGRSERVHCPDCATPQVPVLGVLGRSSVRRPGTFHPTGD